MQDRKIYSMHTSNRITFEDLTDVKKSVFEGVYFEADQTLFRIVKDERKYCSEKDQRGCYGMDRSFCDEDEKDDAGLNVISFLGARGRGKTSAMLSFLLHINKLTRYQWSSFYEEKIKFYTLPYIDASMLAGEEYIFDVILAEMWDKFESYVEADVRGVDDKGYVDYLRQDITQRFIDVRRAYLVLKEREAKAVDAETKDIPVPSALHELAVSVNLRKEMQGLVKRYLQIFHKSADDKAEDAYLVITLDDVDMSGNKVFSVLEQIRRFLRIPGVIVLLTSDVERLHQTCEAHFCGLYKDQRDLQHLVDEYLEKVLPYNMRVYMPELWEQREDIIIDEQIRTALGLDSHNERDMILEFMAKKCGIYFDGQRRWRHFLQNKSMRSMVNYFEQLLRENHQRESYLIPWLKSDLRERLVERLENPEQRAFMKQLLERDYEDVNGIVLSYINDKVKDGGKPQIHENSMGQVLYACSLLEDMDARNADLVNCILMLYSIMMRQEDEQMKEKIIGNSAFGEWEYNMVDIRGQIVSELNQGFKNKAVLRLDVSACADFTCNVLPEKWLMNVYGQNREELLAWLYTLLFGVVISPVNGKYFTITISRGKENEKPVAGELWAVGTEKFVGQTLEVAPNFQCRKNYFGCVYVPQAKFYDLAKECLIRLGIELQQWYCKKGEIRESISRIRKRAEKNATELLIEAGFQSSQMIGNQEFRVPDPEILYSIGRALEAPVKLDPEKQTEAYDMNILTLTAKYETIKLKLDQIVKYYCSINCNTSFASSFSGCIQTKLLFGGMELSETLRNRFVAKLSDIMTEVRLTAVNPPSV